MMQLEYYTAFMHPAGVLDMLVKCFALHTLFFKAFISFVEHSMLPLFAAWQQRT